MPFARQPKVSNREFLKTADNRIVMAILKTREDEIIWLDRHFPMTGDDIISVTYKPDPSHATDYILGYQHQAYENYGMIFDKSWGRHFFWIRTDLSLLAALAAAAIYSVTLPWFPGVWPVVGYWVFAPALLVALSVWSILWYGARRSTVSYNEAFARWNIEYERLYSPQLQAEIGPQGFRQITNTYTVHLSWAHYHIAIIQPDSLVLVFHGTVAVIPNSALPISPADIVKKIHGWSLAQQKEMSLINQN